MNPFTGANNPEFIGHPRNGTVGKGTVGNGAAGKDSIGNSAACKDSNDNGAVGN